jgi:hypothetical protein
MQHLPHAKIQFALDFDDYARGPFPALLQSGGRQLAASAFQQLPRRD